MNFFARKFVNLAAIDQNEWISPILQFCQNSLNFSMSKQPACRLFSSSSTVPELPNCLLSFLKPPANLQVEHKFHSLQSPALPNSNCVDECFALWKLFFDVAKFPPLIALPRLSNYWNFAAILFCSRASPWRCSTVSWTRRSATPCGTTGSGGGRVADCTIPGAAAEAVEWRAADRPVPSAELADPAVAESERWAAGRLKKVRVPSPRAPGTISIIHWIKRTRVTGASMLTDFTRSKEQLKRFACLTRVLCELRPRVILGCSVSFGRHFACWNARLYNSFQDRCGSHRHHKRDASICDSEVTTVTNFPMAYSTSIHLSNMSAATNGKLPALSAVAPPATSYAGAS